jgi:hypothetical protein
MTRLENGIWNPPKVASFCNQSTIEKYTIGGPTISQDGKMIFVDVGISEDQNPQFTDYDIWFMEQEHTGWSDLINPGPPLNSDQFELCPTISSKRTIYYQSPNIVGGFGSVDLYRAEFKNGLYQKPENLGDSINSSSMEVSPFIAPDESYLLFSSFRAEGHGDFDIYVSFRKKDGSWTKARNLGETINTSARETTSVVSPDGKYLFFMSRRNGIGEYFWVDAKIIEKIKTSIK